MANEEEKELTESQKVFCREWVFDFNGSRSYKVAYPGVTDETARVNASRLLTYANIKAFCKDLQDNIAELAGISRLKVLREHQKIAFSTMAHLHNTWIERKQFDQLSDDQKACIAEIQTQTRKVKDYSEDPENPQDVDVDFVKVKLWDKQKALDSISKMLGFDSAEKVDITSGGKEMKQFTLTVKPDEGED